MYTFDIFFDMPNNACKQTFNEQASFLFLQIGSFQLFIVF